MMQMNAAQSHPHQRMLAGYGFGLFSLPHYRECRLGAWRLVRHLPSLADGYVSVTGMEAGRYVLSHHRTPWMSTGLLEQESHAYHVHVAKGAVVVAGLGLAMYAHAVAAKACVDRVVVIELSPDVIALMRIASAWDDWPERRKITILEADARDPTLGDHVRAALGGRAPDYLFADIWPRCGQPDAPAEMAGMVRTFCPVHAGWWGQELGVAAWAAKRRDNGGEGAMPPVDAEPAEVTIASLAAYFAEVGVPVPLTAGYVAFCRDVIAMNSPAPRPAPASSPIGRLWRRMSGTVGRPGRDR